ncbi:MAG: hypothetical protein AB2809_21305 [Candidatus Thiodiazotropha sp.]
MVTTFDKQRVMALGLGGQTAQEELAQLRQEQESLLYKAQARFHDKRAAAKAAIDGLNWDRQQFVPEPLVTDDMLGAATVELEERAAEANRKALAKESFRLRHGLARDTTEPDPVTATVLLFLMTLLETAVNTGFLLANGLAASPISAILFSLMVSSANVLVNVMAGFHIGRWKKFGLHTSEPNGPKYAAIRRRKRWQFWVYIGVMALSLTELALVRTQGALDSLQVSIGALAEILVTPDALYLLFTNGAAAVLSYQKGLHAFADPYPYFSQYHHAKVAAYDALQATYAYFAEEVEARHAAVRAALDQTWKENRKKAAQVAEVFNQCLEAHEQLARAINKAEHELRADIATLAQAHRGARGDNTPLPEDALTQLASFQSFLEGAEPPTFCKAPDIRHYRETLDQAKTDALSTLKAQFEQQHCTIGGHSS